MISSSECDKQIRDISYFSAPTSQYTPLNDISNSNIPSFLANSYLNGTPPPKITQLREWQRELLASHDWNEGKNCIVHVPTAGGKTLIAEVAVAQILEKDPQSKIIYCVPFISLAAEKHREFRERFTGFGVRGFYQNIGSTTFTHGNIAICTFEKAHSVINTALKTKTINQIKAIIIDEFHMIGQDKRGPIVEALICKTMLSDSKPRLIGLSATLNEIDAKKFAEWINGFLFETKRRPTQIKQFLITVDGQLCPLINGEIGHSFQKITSIKEDKNHIIPLVANSLKKSGNNVLIFVNNRKETVSLANLLSDNLYNGQYLLAECPQNIKEKRSKLINTLSKIADNPFSTCIMNGIAYHHAGLTLEERELLEEAFRNGVLNVIVATTTLSAGINFLNISLVIIYEVIRGRGALASSLSSASYAQMSGRAGRTKDRPGSVVIIQQTPTSHEELIIKNLSKFYLPQLDTHLLRDNDFDKFFLQCLCFLDDNDTALKLPEKSFHSFCEDIDTDKIINSSIERLTNLGLYHSKQVTKLGSAIASANMSISDGIEVHGLIRKSMKNIILSDPLFIMYICVPPSIEIRTPSYSESIWDTIINTHDRAIEEICSLKKNDLEKLRFEEFRLGKKANNKMNNVLDRIFIASLLVDVTEEKPLVLLERTYKIERGTIQSFQSSSTVFSGQISKFCEVAGFHEMNAIINVFRKRIEYGVKNDLLELVQLNICKQNSCRALANAGIITVSDIVASNIAKISSILSNIDPDYHEKLAETIYHNAVQIYESEQSLQDITDSLQIA